MQRYPLRFRPIPKERVWGGRALATLFGRQMPPGTKVGESWELVDRPPDTSVVENGPLAGRTLHELCGRYGRELLGANAPSADTFPLIVKLLDPNDRLSVQVHPSAPYMARHPEAEGTKNDRGRRLSTVSERASRSSRSGARSRRAGSSRCSGSCRSWPAGSTTSRAACSTRCFPGA